MKPMRRLFRDSTIEYRGDGRRITIDRRDDEREPSPEPQSLASCGNCDRGFRRVEGIHIGSQRLGMIPNTPCDRVIAVCDKRPNVPLARSCLAYVNGSPLRARNGDVRRYTSKSTAYRAARKAAPRKWHP